jgi:RHS repeat-associated protein
VSGCCGILNSVRLVLDESGAILDQIAYDAFGNIVARLHPTTGVVGSLFDNPILFAPREFDAETGLYYHRARYLDPTTGRWTTQDPMGFAAGDANLYRYVGNMATMATDPSGNIQWDSILNWARRTGTGMALGGISFWHKNWQIVQWLGHAGRGAGAFGSTTRLTTWTLLLGSPRLFSQTRLPSGVSQLTLFGLRHTGSANVFWARRIPVIGLFISVGAESTQVGIHLYDALANGNITGFDNYLHQQQENINDVIFFWEGHRWRGVLDNPITTAAGQFFNPVGTLLGTVENVRQIGDEVSQIGRILGWW